jgi:large subunit ribosomal protein L18
VEETLMARGPRYRVPYRRRRKGKTDYKARKALIMSRLPRLVIRRTSKHILVQVINAKIIGDEVLVSAHSRELSKTYGWQGSLSNIPAAYLTGILCGCRALAVGIKKAILDMGLHSSSRGTQIFSALKGSVDAGMAVPHKNEMLPEEPRIRGDHIADYASKLSSSPETYQDRFSKYLSRDLRPENISEHFSQIKDKIMSNFQS